MRKLVIMLMLLLLLPMAFGNIVRADETDPPPDPGTQDGGGGDLTGDHPWGGNDNVIVVEPDTQSDLSMKQMVSFSKYLQIMMFTHFGVDTFDRPAKTTNRTSTTTRYTSRRTFTGRFQPVERSRR